MDEAWVIHVKWQWNCSLVTVNHLNALAHCKFSNAGSCISAVGSTVKRHLDVGGAVLLSAKKTNHTKISLSF